MKPKTKADIYSVSPIKKEALKLIENAYLYEFYPNHPLRKNIEKFAAKIKKNRSVIISKCRATDFKNREEEYYFISVLKNSLTMSLQCYLIEIKDEFPEFNRSEIKRIVKKRSSRAFNSLKDELEKRKSEELRNFSENHCLNYIDRIFSNILKSEAQLLESLKEFKGPAMASEHFIAKAFDYSETRVRRTCCLFEKNVKLSFSTNEELRKYEELFLTDFFMLLKSKIRTFKRKDWEAILNKCYKTQ